MIHHHSKYHHIDSAFIYGFAVLSVIALFHFENYITHYQKRYDSRIEQTKHVSIFREDVFSNIKIKGKSYVVYDIVDQKVIAGKNIDTTLPLASVTKVMTAITARRHFDKETLITITNKNSNDFGLKKGQVWTLDELLKYTLTISSNNGAEAIAEALGGRKKFISQMNHDAYDLGLSMYFTNPAGLDESGKIGGLGSSLAVAKMFTLARREFPEIFDVTTKKRVTVHTTTTRLHGIPNTNQEVANLSGIEASKTGFTDMAGGNLAVIVDITVGHPVVIVVLGSTHEERFSDVEVLYQALQKSLKK